MYYFYSERSKPPLSLNLTFYYTRQTLCIYIFLISIYKSEPAVCYQTKMMYFSTSGIVNNQSFYSIIVLLLTEHKTLLL